MEAGARLRTLAPGESLRVEIGPGQRDKVEKLARHWDVSVASAQPVEAFPYGREILTLVKEG